MDAKATVDDRVLVVLSVRVDCAPGPLSPEAADLIFLLRRLVVGDGPLRVETGERDSAVHPGGQGSGSAVAGDGAGDDPATVRICPDSRTVLRAGRHVPLTRLEFDLLVFLAQHPRRVFTRAQLLDRVWGNSYSGQRTVDVHVRRVRAKMGVDTPVVSTVRGIGYRLGDAVRAVVSSRETGAGVRPARG